MGFFFGHTLFHEVLDHLVAIIHGSLYFTTIWVPDVADAYHRALETFKQYHRYPLFDAVFPCCQP